MTRLWLPTPLTVVFLVGAVVFENDIVKAVMLGLAALIETLLAYAPTEVPDD